MCNTISSSTVISPTKTEAIPENIKLPTIILITYTPDVNPLRSLSINPEAFQLVLFKLTDVGLYVSSVPMLSSFLLSLVDNNPG
jgi:hypothetical protein